MIELQKCSDAERWDEFILEHDGHPLQLWEWGEVKSRHGWVAERLFLKNTNDNDKIIAAAQILIRPLPSPFRSVAYIPKGPIADTTYNTSFLEAIAEFVKRDYHSVALTIEPNTISFQAPDGWRHSTNQILSPQTIVLDLTMSEANLQTNMVKKTRQYIRKSTNDGVVIKQLKTADQLLECLNIYKQTAERAGFNLHNNNYYQDIYACMKDYSPVFAAYVNKKMVAFLWMAISAKTAYELYGGMNEDGQRIRANYALKWHVIQKMKEWGLQEYDFGGLVAGGVSIFKQGWSSEETVFVGTFDKPLSPLYLLWNKGLPTAKTIVHKLKKS